MTAAPAQTERGASGRHRRDGHRFWPRAQRALAISALCAALPVAAVGQNQLPDFGDSASATLSPADEREIGAYIMRQIRAQLPVINDPEIEGYVQNLGYSLVSGASEGTTDFHFFVIADPTVNAFALPGGYIGVHSGLITNTDSESELASVMAHEIAHVTQRHIARAIAAAEGSQYTTLLAVIAGILIGTQNSQAGQATIAGATAASAQSQINFTRTNEKEADRVGIGMLAKAGYDPRAMPTFFEKLDIASRYYSRPPEFLSTHPVTTSRIADSRGRAEQYPYKQFTDSVSYGLTRAKLRVLTTNNPARQLATYEAKLKEEKTGDRSPALYGRALVLTKLGKTERASAELRKLIEAHPERVRFRVALAKQQLVSGDTKQALATYQDAYALFPDSKQVVGAYVDALLRNDEGARALVILDDYSRIYAKDAALYRLEAEAFRLNGAIHQLQLASNEPDGGFYQNSRLDARLKELKAERDFLMRH